ncbi:MAG: Ty1/Copia family ribonuclease HI, partial [Gorillibacterium sp.]|nr:Ty1/Copia family ribonuclease HI [Gorillibacterium sp.]
EIQTDASFPGEEARGTTGVVVRIGEQLVHWYTRRQETASLSNSEAEYIAAAEGAKDASWLRQVLEETKLRAKGQAISLRTDNDATQKLCQNTSYRKRTRHLDIKYHYIRDQVNLGHLKVTGIPGKENMADLMTKLMSTPCLKKWMDMIGIVEAKRLAAGEGVSGHTSRLGG